MSNVKFSALKYGDVFRLTGCQTVYEKVKLNPGLHSDVESGMLSLTEFQVFPVTNADRQVELLKAETTVTR